MDINSLGENTLHAVKKLLESWQIKSILAGALGVLQFHAELLGLFVLIVIIDLITKWISLSYSYLVAYNVKAPGVAQCVVAIPAAHRAGVINSYKMKTRFAGKLIIYLLLATAAGAVDRMLVLMHHPAIFLSLCVGYLAATELLSCIENLNDANVSIAAKLVEKVKGKI